SANACLRVAARELLAQSGESLVVGKRAGTGRVGRERLAGNSSAEVVASGCLGLGCLGNRSLVSLPASLGCSVLLLPCLALGVEAFLPRTGLGVEALRVLVLAVLVVLGEHAVQRRVELGAVGADRLVGLLERQRDATTLEVDGDDLDEDLFADGHDLLSQLDVLAGELGDVHEALDAVCNADERTERNELGDLARGDLTDR